MNLPPVEPPIPAVPAPARALPADAKSLRRALRELRERADYLDASGSKLLKKHGKTLATEVDRLLRDQLSAMRGARTAAAGDGQLAQVQALDRAVAAFDEGLTVHLGQHRKSPTREFVEAIAVALLLTLAIRAFVFEAFKIPTGSMIPTLQIHDHLFVNKFLYGLKIPFTRIKFLALRDPAPGEIVVFEYPYDDDADSSGKDLIKRVIAVAGQKVRLVDNVIHIDGKPVKRKILEEAGDCGASSYGGMRKCRIARECLGGKLYITQHHVSVAPGLIDADNSADWPPAEYNGLRYGPHAMRYSPPENKDFPDFVVPVGHLLVMGDNRDNSKDGRFFGLVPLDTVKGKAGTRWWAYHDRTKEQTDAEGVVGQIPDWLRPDGGRMFEFVHTDVAGGTCDGWDPSKDAVP